MGLTSALYTGLSGLNVNQQKLNVIGNNIANANTVAFKSSRALFKPQFYVTDHAGSAPTADSGGTNTSQRGLGAVVATIQKNFEPGSIESTGYGTDLALDGGGFFIVGNDRQQSFTRDGSFTLNANHELITSNGEYVQGYGINKDFEVDRGQLSRLTIPIGQLTIASATSKVELAGNLNANGVVSAGASVLESPALLDALGASPTDTTLLTDLRLASDAVTPMFSDGQKLTLAGKRGGNTLAGSTFDVGPATTVAELNNFFRAGMAIDTSAPVVAAAPAGYTPGVGLSTTTAAGDPAGSLRLQVTGNAGLANALDIGGTAFISDSGGGAPFIFNDATNSSPTGESLHTETVVYDSLGTPLSVDVTLTLQATGTGGTTWRYFATSADSTNAGQLAGADTDVGMILGSGTIDFDNNGVFASQALNTVAVPRSNTGAANPLSVELDFSHLNSLTAEASKVTPVSQDGFETGTLNDFSIGEDGTVTGFFSNGLKRTLAQVAVASFENPEGLVDQGSNKYTVGASSGQAIVSQPGDFGAGMIRSGSLEQSNVDLSKEFINMIVTSTGFSAASRVITTSDQLLNELLQTSR
jgi:flagellar hook protein FlgE